MAWSMPKGSTRARVYRLKVLTEVSRRYPREGLQEDLVWRNWFLLVARFAQNVRDIWHYAATEMINNAIDHSGAADVLVEVRKNELWTEVLVADEGEGIFVKIQRALGLHDPRKAIQSFGTAQPGADLLRQRGERSLKTGRCRPDLVGERQLPPEPAILRPPLPRNLPDAFLERHCLLLTLTSDHLCC